MFYYFLKEGYTDCTGEIHTYIDHYGADFCKIAYTFMDKLRWLNKGDCLHLYGGEIPASRCDDKALPEISESISLCYIVEGNLHENRSQLLSFFSKVLSSLDKLLPNDKYTAESFKNEQKYLHSVIQKLIAEINNVGSDPWVKLEPEVLPKVLLDKVWRYENIFNNIPSLLDESEGFVLI